MLKKFFLTAACVGLLASSAAAAQSSTDPAELGKKTYKAITDVGDQRYVKRDELPPVQSMDTAPASAKPGSYADKSARYTVYLANCTSGGMNPSLRDEAARKFDAMSETEFRKQLDLCPRAVQDRKEAAQMKVADTRVNADVDINIGNRPVYGNRGYGYGPAPAAYTYGRGYRSFDNVAADSLRVRSHGKDFNLRNTGGNTQACHPPRKLVRTDRCGPTPDGRGVRCAFDCR